MRLLVFNTTILPNKYEVIGEHDFSTNANSDMFSITRCLVKYKWGEKFICDIIIESKNDLKLVYSGDTFYCKQGFHYLPSWLSGEYGGDLQICENQKYKIHLVKSADVGHDLSIMLSRYCQIVYLEDFYSDDTNAMIGHYAAYFGIVSNAHNRLENVLDNFNFDDRVTYDDFLKYLELGHFTIKFNKRKRNNDDNNDSNDDKSTKALRKG